MSDMLQLAVSSDSSELVASLTEDRSALKATESAFRQFGDAVVSVMAVAADVSVAALKEIGGGLRTLTEGALNAFGAELGSMAGKVVAAGAAVGAASSYFGGLWATMRAGLAVAGFFNPWLRAVSLSLTTATVATWAYGHANESLRETIRGIGSDIAAVGKAAGTVVADATGATAAVSAVNSAIIASKQQLAEEAKKTADGYRIIADAVLDLGNTAGPSTESLRKMTAATEAAIAKAEASVGMFQQLKEMQANAATQAAHAAEIQRIASITTVEAVNAEIQALQQKAAQAIAAGDATAESQKRTADMFAALESQKFKIADNDKAAALKKEEEAQKALNKAKEDQKRLDETAADQIARLQDQIELMTGAATQAEIAMREALRAGLSQEQAEQIAKLTGELEKLKEQDKAALDVADKETKSKPDRAILKSAFAGSQEAASILLRGVGGGPGSEIPAKQLSTQQQILAATKANKPQTLTPLTLGVA